jgi:Tfp pilus assembly protein PilZ
MEQRESGRDKRLALRTAVEYRVRFKSELLEFDTRGEVVGEVLDMSRTGMFIRSEFLEAPGTPVALLVWLPDQPEPVSLRGTVAWVAEHPPKGPGMGIKLSQNWES